MNADVFYSDVIALTSFFLVAWAILLVTMGAVVFIAPARPAQVLQTQEQERPNPLISGTASSQNT